MKMILLVAGAVLLGAKFADSIRKLPVVGSFAK